MPRLMRQRHWIECICAELGEDMRDRPIDPDCDGGYAAGLKYSAGRARAALSLIPSGGRISRGKALDIGCGEGVFSRILCERGYECLGIDTDAGRIESARRSSSNERLKFEVQNATELQSPDGSYDVVLCLEVVEHLDSPDKLLTEIRRVMKPEGLLVISTPNRCSLEGLAGRSLQKLGLIDWKAWDPTHQRIFSSSEFLALMDRHGFRRKRTLGYYYLPSVYRFESARILNRLQYLLDPLRYACFSQPLLNRFGFNIICALSLRR